MGRPQSRGKPSAWRDAGHRTGPSWHRLNTALSNPLLTKKFCFNKSNPNTPEVYGSWTSDRKTWIGPLQGNGLFSLWAQQEETWCQRSLHVFRFDGYFPPLIHCSHQPLHSTTLVQEPGVRSLNWNGQSSRRGWRVVQERAKRRKQLWARSEKRRWLRDRKSLSGHTAPAPSLSHQTPRMRSVTSSRVSAELPVPTKSVEGTKTTPDMTTVSSALSWGMSKGTARLAVSYLKPTRGTCAHLRSASALRFRTKNVKRRRVGWRWWFWFRAEPKPWKWLLASPYLSGWTQAEAVQ